MNPTQEALSDVRDWQRQRIASLRLRANEMDQVSREMHATADQIEEQLNEQLQAAE